MAKGGFSSKRSSMKGGMKSFSRKGSKGGKSFKFGRPAGCCSLWLLSAAAVLMGSLVVLAGLL